MTSGERVRRGLRQRPPECAWRRRAAIGVGSLACALVLSSCGGSQKSPDDASGASAAADSGEVTWQSKTREQRMDWMGLEVFPKMRAAFVEFDAERFSDFKCQTCHSDEMEIVDYEMPTSALFALSATDPVAEARDYDAPMTEFMIEVVVPEMAKLLDTQPYDPETNSGFGCFGCHPAGD